MNERQKIILVMTGGTIDKSYDEFDGTMDNRESLVKSLVLDRLRFPYLEIEQVPVLSKDSLKFTDDDRNLLTKSLEEQNAKGHPIVVLHGTDTMAKSAEHVQANLSGLQVPIIFTGAMRPVGFMDSDAAQNIIVSLMSAQIVSPGIYINFHLRLYNVPGVRKNPQLKTFEAF